MDVTLTKHHGLGNDFLVLDRDDAPAGSDWSALARRWCDRRTGVGADGLLVLEHRGGNRLGMALFNSDGSRAEMSGNGIRCLVQAADRRAASNTLVVDTYVVDTDAGERVVEVVERVSNDTVHLSVDMGTVGELSEPSNWSALECHPDRPVRHLSLGNPHSVVGVDDVDAVDLLRLGSLVPQVNLEVVAPGPEIDAVTMRVHERGAGLTQACGTGACAVAEAALSWGLVPGNTDLVRVHMPGGDVAVRIERTSRRATLVGPAVYVASCTVPL